MEKLVTIIVPTYNHENYVVDCLNSIKGQTYKRLELLIGDDCSSDKTVEYCQKWVIENADRFERIQLFKNSQNKGVSKNFNDLIRKASGEYIKLLASDDILLDTAIQSFVENDKDEYDIIFSNAIRIDINAVYPINRGKYTKKIYNSPPASGDNIKQELLHGDYIAAPTVIFKKRCFDKYGLFREDLKFEDWEYWLRITTNGGIVGYIDCITVGYRMLEESTSHFSKGDVEEKRFCEFMNSELKVLNEYSENNKDIINEYYNRAMIVCMDNEYDRLISDIANKPEYKYKIQILVRYILYKIKVYGLLKKIVATIKGR